MSGQERGIRWLSAPAVTVVGAAVALVVAATTLVGFVGQWWWVFDIVANYRVQLAVLALVVAGALLALRRLPWAALAGLALVLNAALIVPLYVEHPAPAAPGSPTIVVAHVNMQGRPGVVEEFLGAVAQGRVDVFVVLEPNPEWSAAVRGGLARDYQLYEADPAAPGRSPLIVARVSIHGLRLPDVAELPRSGVEFRFDLDGRDVEVLAVHTLSPKEGARSVGRDAQFEAIGRWVDARSGPAIVLGDLNATPWSHALRGLLDTTDLESSQDGFGIEASWPVSPFVLRVPIDHSLHTPELTVTDRSLGPGFGSVHRSLAVTYAFR